MATTVGVGTLATAGCSQLPFVGSGGSYTKWLHEPDEFDANHYTVTVLEPETVINNEDVFDDDYVSSLENQYDGALDVTGVDTDETQQIVSTNVSSVYTGGFAASDVRDELEDNDFDDDDEVGGFTLYANENESRAWAVGSNALIRAFPAANDTALDVVETVVEVSNGEAPRYADEVEAMNVLTSTLSNGFGLFAWTHDAVDNDNPEAGSFENSVGAGISGTLNGDTVNVEYVIAYEDSDDVDQGDLEDWVDAQEDNTFADVDDISYNTSGRAGVISGSMDADDVTMFG